MQKIKIVLSIRSLNVGGAERQFIELVRHIDKRKFDVVVCSMYGGMQEDIIKNISDITYYNLQKKGRYDLYEFYSRYKKILKKINPNVIYSFLGEMNIFSLWCKPTNAKIIWGLRASNMDLKRYGKVSQILFWLQKKSSIRVDKIITNSYASIEFHKKKGFYMNKSVVIHNGIDINKFQKDENKRKKFRKKYNLNEKDIAIGIVARIDVMKGYPIFVNVARKLIENYDNLKFFVIGDGDENIKKECRAVLGIYNNTSFIWLGKQRNVENFYSGFDIVISSSIFGEGFSNSIGEAMSCGVPCVVTNVGDSKIIVKDTGIVIKPNNVESLYNGIKSILKNDLVKLGKKSREIIIKNFSIKKMVKKTESEIESLL